MRELIVGKADLPAGEGRIIEIEGKKIALFFSHNEYYAFDNTCPADEGGSLGKGFLDGKRENVSCPWYGHSYNIKTGKSLFGDGEVRTYKIKIKDSNVVIVVEDE